MMKLFLLSISLLVFCINPSFSQTFSKDYQAACIQEQLSEHKGLKQSTLTEDDFKPFCTCVAGLITQNATNRQLNEFIMDPKLKPAWLKALESNAANGCLSADSKLKT